MHLFDLSGKVAIVTGASRGLGKAMAIGLASAGADVVVTDVLDVRDTVQHIVHKGRKSLGLKIDVTKERHVRGMVKDVLKKFGRIDILINNAGIYRPGLVESLEESDWDKILSINLKGQFLCAKAVGKQMIAQKSGKIINVASVAGIMAFGQSAAYNASKGGVIMLTKTLAVDWAKHNINVNAICPGAFETPMTAPMMGSESFQQMIKNRVPLQRMGKPEDIVGTAIYLASHASDYMTGNLMVVDGGWVAGL